MLNSTMEDTLVRISMKRASSRRHSRATSNVYTGVAKSRHTQSCSASACIDHSASWTHDIPCQPCNSLHLKPAPTNTFN